MFDSLAHRVFGVPHLIARAKLDVILHVLGPRLQLEQLPAAQLVVPQKREALLAPSADGIAVLPIHGTLVKRTAGLDALSGLTSYLSLSAQLDALLADPSVSGIVLDIDSPGGEAGGVFDLARRVRSASGIKPIWAVANDAAYSAAYAIAAAADHVVITDTGGVGSIGVIALHLDQSARDATQGLRYTPVIAGNQKNDLSPHEPLGVDARARLQGEVDRLYGLFIDHVAAMRGLNSDAIRATEAGLFFGPDAVQAGLADGVGTLDDTVQQLQAHLAAKRLRSPPTAHPSTQRAARVGASTDTPTTTTEPKEIPPVSTAPTELIDVATSAAHVAEAKRDAQQSAHVIAELCLLAGCPERAASFIAAGLNDAAVRAALINAKAQAQDSTAVQSLLAPSTEAVAVAAASDTSPVVRAVKKRLGVI